MHTHLLKPFISSRGWNWSVSKQTSWRWAI